MFFILCALSSNVVGQCNTDKLSSACIPKLGDGFNFLKSYSLDSHSGTKQKVEYSYVLTKGTQYMIALCTDENTSEGILVNLFDGARNRIASANIGGKAVSAIRYTCSVTGIYYMHYTFPAQENTCAGSALGFKRISPEEIK
jgi:hypothetical protein